VRRRKVGTVPAKADHDGQAAFLKGELALRLEEAKQGKRSVLFVDAAHFVFAPFLGYLECLVRLFVPGPSGPFGVEALRRPGGHRRGDAPHDPGDEPRLRQHVLGFRPAEGGRARAWRGR
jgi:hypothetical protein